MAAPFSSLVCENEDRTLTRTCRGNDSPVQRALGWSSWVHGLYSRAGKRLLLG